MCLFTQVGGGGELQDKTRNLDLWYNPKYRGITYLLNVGVLYTIIQDIDKMHNNIIIHNLQLNYCNSNIWIGTI
jgi:hypothetical protein